MAEPHFSILHISDLHFNEYLQNSKDTISSHVGAKPHHYRHVQGLCTQKRLIESKSEIDFVVVTGDLTTTANVSAFEEVNNFLRGTKYVSKENKIGLNRGQSLLVVPGNHDTWHKRFPWSLKALLACIITSYSFDFRGEEWNHCFLDSYPYIRPYPNNGNPKVVFIGINTNKFDYPNLTEVSKGQVGSRQLADISNIEGKWPTALKIALMHHHIALPQGFPTSKYTALIDDTPTIEALFKAGVDLVLCGHEHKQFHLELEHNDYQGKKLFLSCAGSATQMHEEENSFKLYRFFDDRIEIRIWSNEETAGFNEKTPIDVDYPNGSPWTR